MLLYFLITCLSFFLFSKSLSLKPLPPWACEARTLLSFWFNNRPSLGSSFKPAKKTMPRNPKPPTASEVVSPAPGEMSVLDLPDLALECILDRLPPSGLCSMAGVCSSLRERCVSDHLWEKHLKMKWGKILGPAAHREWQWYIASGNDLGCVDKQAGHRGFVKLVSLIRSISSLFRSKVVNSLNFDGFGDENKQQRQSNSSSSLPVDSIMNWYLALETGRFWFPAQVYNRENGHVGFMLSCYDAELSYDPHSDTFQARYPPHGRRAVAVEKGVTWERLRAQPIDASPHHLHVSDCLNELKPGDHIEIQWRRNKEFPYGWWYGVVGHLDSCDGNENHCHCHLNETVVLEFNQYTLGSRWRRTTVNRRDHREEGNEADGFYGGIRKLKSQEEICTWKRLWPVSVLE
ncbi:PREDICTED: F-box protein At2g32560 [Tarenaya hassleriana]|uniref:F-box protein At2g32560 n=1 Tax=Tarenaya hassleriana TaxID=28532 RepID=UPI00053C1F4B|nr:PREDICTED: F-box protein At2g32560 [Tarenaya hassleriana]